MSKVYVLRTCEADLTSYNGFQYPESGYVEALDWDPIAECGKGLHGFLHGEGDYSLASFAEDAKWMVLEVEKEGIVDLGEKVKFESGEVVYCGDRKGATDFLREKGCRGPIVGGIACVGDGETVVVGDMGIATAGNGGIATAGNDGTATVGNGGTATAGRYGTATAGDDGTATAGRYGTATAGYCGTATVGYGGKATAGAYGTATVGDGGTATAGNNGTATAGNGGRIRIEYCDGNRYRDLIGYVGEGGIKPNVAYRVEGESFVKA